MIYFPQSLSRFLSPVLDAEMLFLASATNVWNTRAMTAVILIVMIVVCTSVRNVESMNAVHADLDQSARVAMTIPAFLARLMRLTRVTLLELTGVTFLELRIPPALMMAKKNSSINIFSVLSVFFSYASPF